MSERFPEPGDVERSEAAGALRAVRRGIHWKPGKAEAHLAKRKDMGHLAQHATMDDYNSLIEGLAWSDNHRVYLYRFGENRYYAVRGTVDDLEWLALFDQAGIMETAFPPADMDDDLESRGFRELGTVGTVIG